MPEESGFWIIDKICRCIHRGPYKYGETAAAVRHEMEMQFPARNWNLEIVEGDAPFFAQAKEIDRA